MNSFYEHHKDSINWRYRCFARILLNGLIQPFQQPERVVGFVRTYRPVAPRPDRSFTPTHATMGRRKPIAATVTIQPQEARTRGEIAIAPQHRPPRFRALALFGRRPPQCVDGFVMPASKKLHKDGNRSVRSACPYYPSLHVRGLRRCWRLRFRPPGVPIKRCKCATIMLKICELVEDFLPESR